RDVVQSDIDQSSDSIGAEDAEELSGVFLGKTDRKDFHVVSSTGSNKVGCTNAASCRAASLSKVPSPRMCWTVMPRRARTRPTSRWRWQTAGFSSLHIMATR